MLQIKLFRKSIRNLSGLIIILLLLSAVAASGQSTSGRKISWNSIDGSTFVLKDQSSRYTLYGTVGQADTGALKSDRFYLIGGFWSAWIANEGDNYEQLYHRIYLPVVAR